MSIKLHGYYSKPVLREHIYLKEDDLLRDIESQIKENSKKEKNSDAYYSIYEGARNDPDSLTKLRLIFNARAPITINSDVKKCLSNSLLISNKEEYLSPVVKKIHAIVYRGVLSMHFVFHSTDMTSMESVEAISEKIAADRHIFREELAVFTGEAELSGS